MAIANFSATVTDYTSASRFVGDRRSRKLAHNTYVHVRGQGSMYGEVIDVEYHGHVIARFYTGGNAIYTNAGYPTQSTRGRLNKLSAYAGFTQRNHIQFVIDRHSVEHDFAGVVEVSAAGDIVEIFSPGGQNLSLDNYALQSA